MKPQIHSHSPFRKPSNVLPLSIPSHDRALWACQRISEGGHKLGGAFRGESSSEPEPRLHDTLPSPKLGCLYLEGGAVEANVGEFRDGDRQALMICRCAQCDLDTWRSMLTRVDRCGNPPLDENIHCPASTPRLSASARLLRSEPRLPARFRAKAGRLPFRALDLFTLLLLSSLPRLLCDRVLNAKPHISHDA